MRPDLLDELRAQIAEGRLLLFTGAGFSCDARSCSGDPLPTSEELRRLMWGLAFPDRPIDDSELADVYACALAVAPEETGELLRQRLRVDEASLPDSYRTWFSMPWHRMYTLNVDDLDEAAQRRFDLPTRLQALSALTDELPARAPGVLSVHLNGMVHGYPAITFSHHQYGQRTASPDPWYQHLAQDLSAHPVLFVGTTLAEPPLWQQFAMRFDDLDARANRPRSYMVSPALPLARQQILRQLNVEWIEMEHARFAEEVLTELGDAAEAGHAALRAGG